VVALTRADSGALVTTLVGVVAFGAVAWFALRRALEWLERHATLSETSRFAGFLGLALVSAWATELIGVHALFGAFVTGAFVNADGRIAAAVTARLRDLVGVLLLPTFFVVTGLRTDVGSLDGAADLLALGVLLAVAVLGKLGGTWLAGLWVGMPSRFAAALGLLMNTRGLMGLVVLDVGLSMGLLSPRLFTLFVLVALLTTAMTGPLLRRLSPVASAGGDPR
jgi:Kef-type K+ transport system membrane component KefB